MSTICLSNITKFFGETVALDNISVPFSEKKIYGLLGRNGAGKSTLLNIITNRIFATRRNATIDNLRLRENDFAQDKIFFKSEKSDYPLEMKISEVFKWMKGFYPGFDTNYGLFMIRKSAIKE